MGLDKDNMSSFALGNSITITTIEAATATTRFDEIISFTDGNIYVYNKDHSIAGTITLIGTNTINEFFGALSNYNISASINDGIISLNSADGAYVQGDIIDALGIELRSAYVTITSGASNTSSDSVKYLVTLNATMTDDFLLTTGMEKDRIYNIVYNQVDYDQITSSGALGNLTTLHTYTVSYTDSGLIINGPTSYTIALDDTITFAEFFNAFASSLGVNGSIHDGIVQLDADKGVYLTGDFITDVLGVSQNSNSTITTADYIPGKVYPMTSTTEVYAKDGTLFEEDDLLYKLLYDTSTDPDTDYMLTLLGVTQGDGSMTAFTTLQVDLRTTTLTDLIDQLADLGITASYTNHKLTIGDPSDTALIFMDSKNLLTNAFHINYGEEASVGNVPFWHLLKDIDIKKEYVDAEYNCDINMSAGIIDNGSGSIDYVNGVKTITISTTATGSKTITVDITATCTATQTVPVTVTEMMTLDSSFYQLGMYSASGYIDVMYEGTAYTITITSDNTVWDMVSALGGYGISAMVHNGAITIQGTHNGYITNMSSSVKSALGMDYVYQWSETRPTQNYTYLGSTLTIEETRTLASDTKFSELGVTSNGTIRVNYEGDNYTVTIESDDTIDDMLTSLAGLGISGNIVDGK